MAKKPCVRCSKEIGWISQNKIDNEIYCEECFSQIKKEKKEQDKEEKTAPPEKEGAAPPEKEAAAPVKKESIKPKKQAALKPKKPAAIGPKKQNVVLYLTAVMLALILFFPPFYGEYNGSKVNMGYNFIIAPPELPAAGGDSRFASTIDLALLLVQYLFIITIGGILLFIVKRSNEPISGLNRKKVKKVVVNKKGP